VTIYVSSLKAGEQVTHRTAAPGRKAYLFVIEGAVTLDGETALDNGDQARIEQTESGLTVKADRDADLILLDLPAVP